MQAATKAIDLLREARETLSNGVLPTAGAQQRYACLMIINALGIAEREFSALLRACASDSGTDDRALAASIRAGEFDPPSARRKALLRELRASLRNRLAIDNPRLLDQLSATTRKTD
jgi:hypothetical protein